MALLLIAAALLLVLFGFLFVRKQSRAIAASMGMLLNTKAQDRSAVLSDELMSIRRILSAAAADDDDCGAVATLVAATDVSGAAVVRADGSVAGYGDYVAESFARVVFPTEEGVYCLEEDGANMLTVVSKDADTLCYAWYAPNGVTRLLDLYSEGISSVIADARGDVIFSDADAPAFEKTLLPAYSDWTGHSVFDPSGDGYTYYMFTAGGIKYYAAIAPIADSSLYFITLCSEYVYAANSDATVSATATFFTEAAVVMIVLFVLISTSYTRQRFAVESEKELWRVNAQRYQAAVDQADGIVFEYNLVDHTAIMSRRFGDILGRSPGAGNWPESLIESGAVHQDDVPALMEMCRAALGGEEQSSRELRVRHASGRYVWFKVNVSIIKDGRGRPVRAIGNLVNIDDSKREIATLADMAQRDPLTGLYNKTSTEAAATDILSRGDGYNAMFFIDLDNFKSINDTHGHTVGDAALTEVAEAIERCFRSTDIPGRVGGDEFLVVARGLGGDRERLMEKANELCEALASIELNSEHGLGLSASVGVACSPVDGKTYKELYHKADSACYSVKESGKAGFALYRGSAVEDTREEGEK